MKAGIGLFALAGWLLLATDVHSAMGARIPGHLYTVAIDVDTKGNVVGIKPAEATPPPVAALLEQAPKQWRFTPAMKDGHAASVHSYLVVDVRALPAGTDKFSIQVSYVGVGPEYRAPNTGKGPDYPPSTLNALADSRHGHSICVAVDLALPTDGQLTATDAHITTGAELTLREKLTLIAAIKRYLLQGKVLPELVDGQAVAASMQRSTTLSLFPDGALPELEDLSAGEWPPDVDTHPDAEQAAAVQAAGTEAAYRDASQGHSVLKPSMVDTVTFQP